MKLNLKERWRAFILPYIHKAMEWARSDPDTTYEDWKQICKNYKDTIGKDYERDSKKVK